MDGLLEEVWRDGPTVDRQQWMNDQTAGSIKGEMD